MKIEEIIKDPMSAIEEIAIKAAAEDGRRRVKKEDYDEARDYIIYKLINKIKQNVDYSKKRLIIDCGGKSSY